MVHACAVCLGRMTVSALLLSSPVQRRSPAPPQVPSRRGGCDTPHPHTPPPRGTVGCTFVADIHPIAGSRRASPESSSDSCVSVVGGEQRYQRHLKHRGWQDSERRLRIWWSDGSFSLLPKAVAKDVSKLLLASCAAAAMLDPGLPILIPNATATQSCSTLVGWRASRLHYNIRPSKMDPAVKRRIC
uniref:DUF3778 domain-containing protein n=1 Tax=Oryza glumipatula TaxID=40148 RepID=A0A0E0AZX9_9ORYZ